MVFSNDTIRHIWKVRKKTRETWRKLRLTYKFYTIYQSQHKMHHKCKTSKTAEILEEHKENLFQPWFRYIFLGIQNDETYKNNWHPPILLLVWKAKGYRYFGQSLAVSCTFHHILTTGPNHPASKYSRRRERKTYIHTETFTEMVTDSLRVKCQTSPHMSITWKKWINKHGHPYGGTGLSNKMNILLIYW